MGKTVKKLHSQRCHHERVAVSVLPETREQVYARVYRGVSVECVCGKTLNLEELATGPYPFRCPSCGVLLDENAIDLQAREVVVDLAEASAVVSRVEKLRVRADERGGGIIAGLCRLVARMRLAMSSRGYAKARRRADEDKRVLQYLAFTRYYTGLWYRLTGVRHFCAGKLPNEQAYLVRPHYEGDAAEFTAEPGDASPQSRGVAGEFRVFEELRRCVRDSASPLFGAHLASNLYLPIPDCGRGASQPIWRQVDLVLITCEGVFAIEAKNKGTKVLTSPDFASLAVESRDGTRRSTRWILDQCAGHADALSGAIGVSLDDIYETTVFVRPLGFEGGSSEFSGHVFVGTCGMEKEGDFAAAIEKKVVELRKEGREVFTAERVGELADELVLRFGDLGRGKAERHVARLRELSGSRGQFHGRQVYVSNCH